MNKISSYAQMHFGAPSYQKEHGHMEANLQENPVIAFPSSQKELQQSGKQQHISINTAI